jgi:hypothetical protein
MGSAAIAIAKQNEKVFIVEANAVVSGSGTIRHQETR